MVSNEVIIFLGEVAVPMDAANGYFILRKVVLCHPSINSKLNMSCRFPVARSYLKPTSAHILFFLIDLLFLIFCPAF